MMVSAPIMCVGGIIMALRQDVPLSGVLLVVVPVLGLACRPDRSRRMRPLFRPMQTRIDTINRVLREQITGIRVIRAFVRDAHEQERFAAGQRRADCDVSLRAGKLMALMFPIGHAGRERLQRRRALVRRPPHRQRRACRSAR